MSRTVEILDDEERYLEAMERIRELNSIRALSSALFSPERARILGKMLAHHARIALKCKAVIDL